MPWTKTKDEDAFKDPTAKTLTYVYAIREAFDQLLEKDNRVFIIGQGVDDESGVFGSTKGLAEKFGKDRVMDTPLAENGITGIALGTALAGMRPIIVHMRSDFMLLSMDQIMNHAAKWHYMFGGKLSVPLVIRSIVGRGWGSAAQHSQSLQALFVNIPGLKVVMPSTPFDAKGLLISSVYDNNPVIFIEHRGLYTHVSEVPYEPYRIPLGEGIIRKEGRDVTIVAVSYMAYEAVLAANELKYHGIDCEVIDPRTLKPLDLPLILKSVKKTGQLIVADTGWPDCGIGAEIITRVVEEAFDSLKTAPVRISLPDVPAPASSVLEEEFYPDKDTIIRAVKKLKGKI